MAAKIAQNRYPARLRHRSLGTRIDFGSIWGSIGIHFSTILATCFEKLGRFRLLGCSWGSRDAPGSIFSRFWVDLGSI